ncbi:MAG: PRC-barrel domain-containing protein [Planctomycetaceae bacterium]
MISQTTTWMSLAVMVTTAAGINAGNVDDEKKVKTEEVAVAKEEEVQEEGQSYRAKSVLGSKVMIEGEVSIGKVDDIVFSDEGYVEYLIVSNENKLVTVPWEATKFNFEKRMATVNITQEHFKTVPTYSVEQYPVFHAPQYRVDTYKYYGLTPGQRREIRRELKR